MLAHARLLLNYNPKPFMTERDTQWDYSIWEFTVFTDAPTPAAEAPRED
jgi:hypothetical protein